MDNLWRKYKEASKRKRQTLHSVCVGFGFFVFLYFSSKIFNITFCPVKNIFDISCFGCGLTRGFISIFNLHFKSAIEYNILSIPLFISIFLYVVFSVSDILFDKSYIEIIEKQLSKKYMYFLYVLIIVIAQIFKN